MASNIFQRLLDLLPQEPVSVVTITDTYTDGTVRVQNRAGDLFVVRGEGSVDAVVYLKGGIVQGPAPELPYEEIIV